MYLNTKPSVLAALGVLAFVYFIVFPEDMKAILAPLAAVLELSQSLSPWLYMVIAVGIAAWAIVKTWGQKEVSH